tara:strand:- start:171 stop:1367 length:1197 start_codon:yes stop_codon:yes gene_type:complete
MSNLSAEDVITYVFPFVLSEWKHFFRCVDRCTVEFPELESTFAGLKTAEHVAHETELLAKVGKDVYEDDSNAKKGKSESGEADLFNHFLNEYKEEQQKRHAREEAALRAEEKALRIAAGEIEEGNAEGEGKENNVPDPADGIPNIAALGGLPEGAGEALVEDTEEEKKEKGKGKGEGWSFGWGTKGFFTSNDFSEKNWVKTRVPKLVSFTKLHSHRKRLKDLLNLLREVECLFVDLSEEKDKLYHTLSRTDRELEDVWDTQVLADVEQYTPAIEKVFNKFEGKGKEFHLQYLDALCESGELLNWLATHENTDDFNRLISITKSNTDDAVALNAIASLLSTRNVLSHLLYPSEKFESLKDFLNVILMMKISSEGEVNQIRTASQNFDLLLKVCFYVHPL